MAKKDSADGMRFSRRNFLKSTSVLGLAETVVAPAEADAQSAPPVIGPGDVPVRLNVNGRSIDLLIEPRVTLLDALRTRANLTGNKRGCDRGACGACTMIVDGRTVYSCSTLAIEVQGKQIRTVDGLATGDRLHPVQQAFCDKDALMCGFTSDPERAAALYGARLGLDMALDRSHPDWGRLMFFRCGDLIVEVTHRPGKQTDTSQDKLRGLCWRVADIDATHARLTQSGLDVSEVRTGRKPGTRVMTVRSGTCGVPTLLVQPSAGPTS